MKCKSDPGGFPERKLIEVPSVSPAQMRDIQRTAQDDYGVDILMMTENAGRSVAALVLQMLGGRGRGQRVVVLAGGGNKGAAGLAAARHMTNLGLAVEPVFGEVEDEMSVIARKQVAILRQAEIASHGDETSEITLEDHLEAADLVIDALVGFGLEGPPAGMAAALTELALASGRPILALDMPTGVNATTGEPNKPAIRACTTLVLDLPKSGTFAPPARPYVGEVYLADLGIPRSVHERLGIHLNGLYAEGSIVRIRR